MSSSSTVPSDSQPVSSLKITATDFVPTKSFTPNYAQFLLPRQEQSGREPINGKKCRNFFLGNRLCEDGDSCIYRHEHRTYMQIHRRHYTTHLLTYENLYDNMRSSKAKESFLENYEPQTSRL